ncbi:MAG: hypothetical protein M3179_15370 [Actinomycetota bacterium]|nr:hypothetical protein [Actinomycetota bacterium]
MSEKTTSCADLEEMAAELALGALAGGERATALGHLKDCARCRALVDDLASTADRLLLLAPVMEPPVGFESRVADRVGAEPQVLHARRPRRRWIGVIAAAAALIVALAGVGLGFLASRDDGGARLTVMTAFDRSERSGAICRAVVYGDEPASLMVSLEGVRPDIVGDYAVEAEVEGASAPLVLGNLPVKDGTGALGATIDVPAEDVRLIRVFWQGRVLYEATFRA